jgi:very-short-patch-repair endonuclease
MTTTSTAEDALAFQMKAVGIEFTRQYRFAPPRRWTADFMLDDRFLVEVEGGAFNGGHKRGAAADTDCEKQNAAQMSCWICLRFTPAMVIDGSALATIEAALGLSSRSGPC